MRLWHADPPLAGPARPFADRPWRERGNPALAPAREKGAMSTSAAANDLDDELALINGFAA